MLTTMTSLADNNGRIIDGSNKPHFEPTTVVNALKLSFGIAAFHFDNNTE